MHRHRSHASITISIATNAITALFADRDPFRATRRRTAVEIATCPRQCAVALRSNFCRHMHRIVNTQAVVLTSAQTSLADDSRGAFAAASNDSSPCRCDLLAMGPRGFSNVQLMGIKYEKTTSSWCPSRSRLRPRPPICGRGPTPRLRRRWCLRRITGPASMSARWAAMAGVAAIARQRWFRRRHRRLQLATPRQPVRVRCRSRRRRRQHQGQLHRGHRRRRPGSATESKINAFGSVTGRAGFAMDAALIYAKGGFAWANKRPPFQCQRSA